MIFKFPISNKLFKGMLGSFTGSYNTLYVPKSKTERYCYASLAKSQINKFIKHFGVNGGCILWEKSAEYPGSDVNLITKRIYKFNFFKNRTETKVNKETSTDIDLQTNVA